MEARHEPMCPHCSISYVRKFHLINHMNYCRSKFVNDRIAANVTNVANVVSPSPELVEDLHPGPEPEPEPEPELTSEPAPNDSPPPLGDTVDYSPPAEPEFDVSFELCKLFTLSNQGRGLSDKDVQAFIDFHNASLLKKPTEPMVLDYKNLGEFKKYRQGFVLDDQCGMKTVVITVMDADVPGIRSPVQLPFVMRDLEEWLEVELRRSDYQVETVGDEDAPPRFVSVLKMEAAPVYVPLANGDMARVISTPETADTWIMLQQKLRARPGNENACVAALQLHSDKTLVNHKGTSCHPVKAALFNVSYARRI